jgi:hypothetical protein
MQHVALLTVAGPAKVARVAVADERWLAFRQAALAQGVSVSVYLGRLVETELARQRGRPIAVVDPNAPGADQAISALAEVRASIDELDAIAGRLARSAVAQGGSWSDVASSLELRESQARSAYEGA